MTNGTKETKQAEQPPEQEQDRGAVLSSPLNMAGGDLQAAIRAALLNTNAAVASLEASNRDLFVQSRAVFYDKDLEGVPFMILSAPTKVDRPDQFNGGTREVSAFKAVLLDPEYMSFNAQDAQGRPIMTDYHGTPEPVDVEFSGAYLQNQLAGLTARGLPSRVWTVDYHPTLKSKPKNDPARMMRYWTAAPTGTF